MAAKGRTRLRRSPIAALLRLWARVLLAAISVGALGSVAHARTLATAAAPENSPLGLGGNPVPAHVGAELTQAPESPLESAFRYGQLASDSAYATRGTGTVWDAIKITQAAKAGTAIPHSFELATSGGRFWVHPNATKHMVEYITRNGASHGAPMNSQAMLTSLQAAVEGAAAQGVRFGEMMQVGRWELIFSQGRVGDALSVLKHALYK